MTLPARRPTIAVGLRNWPRTRGGRCSPRRKVFNRHPKYPCGRSDTPIAPLLPPPRRQQQSRRAATTNATPGLPVPPSPHSVPVPPPLPPTPPPQPAHRTRSIPMKASWAATWPLAGGLLLSWQPNRSVTRRVAHIAREVYSAWRGRVGSAACAPSDKLQLLLGDLQLQPNTTQVHKMLQHSCESNGTASHPPRSQSFLTFNEFCVLVTELKRCYDKGIPQSQHCRRNLSAEKPCNGTVPHGVSIPVTKTSPHECPSAQEYQHRQRRSSKAVSKCEVFLGGSCNPTTWRKDVAIPMLEKLAISYYNPQVSNWGPHLVELEHRAKENASVLFFVIDKQTRNVAATVEVAYYSGIRRNLIVVIKPYEERGCEIGKDLISDEELDDLKHGQVLMHFLVERQGIPVFDSIPVALSCTSRVLRDNISVQDLAVADLIQSPRESYDSHCDNLLALRETFKTLDTSGSGKISISDVCVGCEILTGRNVSLADLKPLVLRHSSVLGKDVRNESVEKVRVNWEQFCSIVADLKMKFEKWGLSSIRGREAASLRNRVVGLRDVYLGCSDETSTWAQDIAIPMLKRKGLTYFCPSRSNLSSCRIPVAAMDNSRVLLFVISDKARALSTMTLAAHYIGLGNIVVLCVRYLPEGAVINGEKISEDAIKDYNRGRRYLIDVASKERVPVFDNVKNAVDCVVSKCVGRYRQNSYERTDE